MRATTRPMRGVDWLFAVLVALVTRAVGHHFGNSDGETVDAMLRAPSRA
jgi:hypothetical protein